MPVKMNDNRTISEHLAAAAEAMRRAQRTQAAMAVGELLLQRSQRPSLLLGRGGAILFANAAARKLLDVATLVLAKNGFLGAPSPDSDARLKQALAAVGVNPARLHGGDRVALGLRDTVSGRLVPACLWRVEHAQGPGALEAAASALLIVAEGADQAAPDPTVLAAMFGFTPGEARVASHLLGSQPPKAIAAALGLSVPTVRHHIRSLLQKTGSRDLRDLTRQVTVALGIDRL